MSRAAAALLFLGAAMLAPSALEAQTNIGKGSETSIDTAAGITDSGQFVSMAAVSNIFEIRSSELALEKSQDENVRAFAQQMITDHQAAYERLAAVAAQAEVQTQLPTEVDALHAAKLDTLGGASEFDLQYTKMQIEAHDMAVAMFESFAANGDNDLLKQFAAETLPTLQQHRGMLPEQMPAQ